MWSRLRALVRERGVDPDRIALATLFPDDTDMEFGIVVTPEQEVYEFDDEALVDAEGRVPPVEVVPSQRLTHR
jgi:hypothetical protein